MVMACDYKHLMLRSGVHVQMVGDDWSLHACV